MGQGVLPALRPGPLVGKIAVLGWRLLIGRAGQGLQGEWCRGRCASRAQSWGRDKRKSRKAWSWRETYPMKTATWQLSTLPREIDHCRFTPTEGLPRFGKLLGSKARMRSGSPKRVAT